MKIIITSPSLDVNKKVAGISSVTQFIINHSSKENDYIHFELGTKDAEKRNLLWGLKLLNTYFKWCFVLLNQNDALIHFNTALEKPSIIRDTPLIIIARLFRVRMIIHLHGGEFLMHREMPFWMKYLLKCSLSGKNPKIALSPLEETVLKSRLGLRNLFVLPNCVDLKDAMEFKRDYEKQEMLKFLFLGRISEKKGLEYIYLALQLLKLKGTKFQFIMAGRGTEEGLYIAKFQELLGDDFEFKGVVSGSEKTKILKESNVFLLPSFFEGLPMALLEGMSFGLVPIITNVGSIKYVVNDGVNGITVNKYSADDIVAAVERIAADRTYMKLLSQSARKDIFNNYDPRNYIFRLNEIYSYE